MNGLFADEPAIEFVAMSASVTTYYDVLQVERDASADGVRRAWRRMAQKYHPDKMPGNANAARAMAAINAAYEVLSDPHQRALHDRWIDKAESRPVPLAASRAQAAPAGTLASFNPMTSWPWYLLFATMAFALGTVGTAVYLTTTPVLITAAQHAGKTNQARAATQGKSQQAAATSTPGR